VTVVGFDVGLVPVLCTRAVPLTKVFGGLVASGLLDVTRSWRNRQAAVRKDGQVLELVDTCVTFPAGGLSVESEVLAVVEIDGATLSVVDSGAGTEWDAGSVVIGFTTAISPFHPVDHGWPDQGPDRGTVTIDGVTVDVAGVVLGATQGPNLLTANNIPVRRGEPGWAFVVVHLLAPGSPGPVVGQQVRLDVDASYRESLCFGHTACHIAALALNSALADRWRKPVVTDGLGHPNFDQLALSSSRIRPDGSTDIYRLGKSLRKKGFDVLDLSTGGVAALTNALLARWVEAGATVAILTQGPGLTDRRTWVCDLPDGQERIACGGTHLTSLEGVAAITVSLTLDDAELRMETKVNRA
jgi:alanyl-tRNA synthetase